MLCAINPDELGHEIVDAFSSSLSSPSTTSCLACSHTRSGTGCQVTLSNRAPRALRVVDAVPPKPRKGDGLEVGLLKVEPIAR